MSEGVIEIRGLRCRGPRGTTGAARTVEHDYLVDVWVRADVARAIAEDDVAAATDISAIAATVRVAVAERPRALVERITHDTARALLSRFPEVTEARVRVTRPRPAGLDADAEAVELTLRR